MKNHGMFFLLVIHRALAEVMDQNGIPSLPSVNSIAQSNGSKGLLQNTILSDDLIKELQDKRLLIPRGVSNLDSLSKGIALPQIPILQAPQPAIAVLPTVKPSDLASTLEEPVPQILSPQVVLATVGQPTEIISNVPDLSSNDSTSEVKTIIPEMSGPEMSQIPELSLENITTFQLPVIADSIEFRDSSPKITLPFNGYPVEIIQIIPQNTVPEVTSLFVPQSSASDKNQEESLSVHPVNEYQVNVPIISVVPQEQVAVIDSTLPVVPTQILFDLPTVFSETIPTTLRSAGFVPTIDFSNVHIPITNDISFIPIENANLPVEVLTVVPDVMTATTANPATENSAVADVPLNIVLLEDATVQEGSLEEIKSDVEVPAEPFSFKRVFYGLITSSKRAIARAFGFS